MSLGSYLKEKRENKMVDKSATLEDISKETRIPVSILSKIENGKLKRLNDDYLKALCDCYNIPKKKLISVMYEL